MTFDKNENEKINVQIIYIQKINLQIMYCFSVNGNNIPDITQIGASKIDSRKTFCRYVSPEQIISHDAIKLSGIDWSNGILTYQGNPVNFVGIRTALNDLLDWLKKFDDVIIVAQYGFGFDFKVMDRALCSCDLKDRFDSIGAAFCDSIDIIKEKHPGIALLWRDIHHPQCYR